MIKFVSCSFKDIEESVVSYYNEKNITIDDYWEDHIIESNCYNIKLNKDTIGSMCIYKKNYITFFNIDSKYNYRVQEIFHKTKSLEEVFGAYVVTGDESLMSICMDNFISIEKEAYICKYDTSENEEKITIELATVKDKHIIEKYDDEFFNDIDESIDNEVIYIAKRDEEVVGFGFIRRGSIRKDFASIGMTVRQEFRRQGIGKNILTKLKKIVKDKGLTPISGCWYYNHNSLKTQFSAGAYCNSRVIKFKF